MGAFKTLRTRLLSSQRSYKKYIFHNQKNIFLQNEYIFKKGLYFVCKTNIFCIKMYFSNEICIFYIFIYIFLCKKSFFSVKTLFNIKHFFYIKTYFLQIMYISSKTQIFFSSKTQIFFQKNIFFSNLVLQQMNNH